jgi:hypothetical protein
MGNSGYLLLNPLAFEIGKSELGTTAHADGLQTLPPLRLSQFITPPLI